MESILNLLERANLIQEYATNPTDESAAGSEIQQTQIVHQNLIQTSLKTFHESPFPQELQSSLSHSPLKLAMAGFIRPQNPNADEVICSYCGVEYGGWKKEDSPRAVHMILNPKCPNPLLKKHSEPQNASQQQQRIRRCLFPTLQEPEIDPIEKDRNLLFESHRLLTFNNFPANFKSASVYAKNGFIYNVDSCKVTCIFCNLQLDFEDVESESLEIIHQEKSASCKFVNFFDVGNITPELERQVKEKLRSNFLNNPVQHTMVYTFQHPEYEESVKRKGTYKTWPKLQAIMFPVDVMADCGFYYSGKIICIVTT